MTAVSVGDAVESRPASGQPKALPATRQGRFLVLAVLAFALLIRVAIVLTTQHSYALKTDAVDFDRIGASIASGHGYGSSHIPPAVGPEAYRAPLYPAVLGATYAVFGHHAEAGRLENAVMGVLVVALIGLVAALVWDRRIAFIALLIAAVHPTLMLFGTTLALEPQLVFLGLSAIAAALQYRRSPRPVWLIATGVLLGLTILTREFGWALVPTVAWLVWSAGRDQVAERSPVRSRSGATAAVLVLVLGASVVAPWTIRNAIRLHAFVPVSTGAGLTIAGTYNETSFKNRSQPALWIPAYTDPGVARVVAAHPHPNEAQYNSELLRADATFIEHHLTYVPKAMFWSTVRLFDLRGTSDSLFIGQFSPYPRRLIIASVYASYLLEAFALVGIFLAATRRAPTALWLFPVLAYLTIVAITGDIRFRAFLEPFTVLLAAIAVSAAVDWFGWFRPIEEDAESPTARSPL